MLNSKSIPRVKTGSDRFIWYIDFPPDGFSDIADTVGAILNPTTKLQGDVQITRDVDVDSSAMSLGLKFSFPIEQTVLDGYSKFISGIYHCEIMRNTLFVLIDASTADPLRRKGDRASTTGPIWRCSVFDKDGADPALVEDPEKLISATLQAGDRGKQRWVTGNACPGDAELALICVNNLHRHYSGFEECMREGAADLAWRGGREAGGDGPAKDGSGVGSASSL
ncbi:hypothetical protein EDB92DRAFT_2105911 [Lactarius akahatsu]|uniref:Uncharacterized protein n=1 Tax=Lactarius akahatsu TaxID=416441 RepID=A0AAD4QA96_9AGAM|nr:hypothetical protein EDB92DRAFT_2105911 [Lactarius akahatsu]